MEQMKFSNRTKQIFEINSTDELNDFCITNELDLKGLRKVIDGTNKTHRGFFLLDAKEKGNTVDLWSNVESMYTEIKELRSTVSTLQDQLKPLLEDKARADKAKAKANQYEGLADMPTPMRAKFLAKQAAEVD